MKFKSLTIIAISCLVIIIWINFIDFKLPEIIQGKGIKFENLSEAFCRSFIAAYIFYFLNVYLREKREKKFILPLVAGNVINIIANNHSIIKCLKNDMSLSLKYFPNETEFKELLLKINPTETTTMFSKNRNWLYLFENRRKSTLAGISKIFSSGRHIDDELRKILLQMQSSLYLKEDFAFNSDTFEDKDLAKYYNVFFKYFELIEELLNYYNKNLKTYYESTAPKNMQEIKIVKVQVI